MKKVAQNEFETSEVLANLSDDEKIDRLINMFHLDEVLDILGFYDNSLEDETCEVIQTILDTEPIDEATRLIALKFAINNGNFTESIAKNERVFG